MGLLVHRDGLGGDAIGIPEAEGPVQEAGLVEAEWEELKEPQALEHGRRQTKNRGAGCGAAPALPMTVAAPAATRGAARPPVTPARTAARAGDRRA